MPSLPIMHVVADEAACALHAPARENIMGAGETYREAPRRLTDLLALLRTQPLAEMAYTFLDSVDHGLPPLLNCHNEGYLDWLRTCYEDWMAEGGNDEGVVARIAYHQHFASLGEPPDPTALSLDGRIGLYSWDLGHTVAKETFRSAYAAAQVAVTAADWLLTARSSSARPYVFAATRPPGHHAGSACTGGYCYLSNAAIAARRLQAGHPTTRVAILDLDAHFGNGTAEIFAADPSVLYVSLHADKAFPHFGGRAEDDGIGDGKGYTRNHPLAIGTSEVDYLATLQRGIADVVAFEPTYLVVSLGVDTYVDDPFHLFKMTESGYASMGRRLAQLGLPTCIVMEGGYNLDALPRLFHAVLSSFTLARSA